MFYLVMCISELYFLVWFLCLFLASSHCGAVERPLLFVVIIRLICTISKLILMVKTQC